MECPSGFVSIIFIIAQIEPVQIVYIHLIGDQLDKLTLHWYASVLKSKISI